MLDSLILNALSLFHFRPRFYKRNVLYRRISYLHWLWIPFIRYSCTLVQHEFESIHNMAPCFSNCCIYCNVCISSRSLSVAVYWGASDLTSPIQISRRIYYTFNEKTNSKMSTLNIFAFGIPFIIIRTFILPQFYYVWFTSLEMALLIKVLSIISFALIIVWSYQVFSLLWKQFPYLFDNKEKIERSVVWRKGREIMQTIRKDAGYSMGFNSAIFAITVILPLIISIQHSPIGFN